MLDTRMSLDQGKDGRLLRLNMNDANWTDRLLRNIQRNWKGGDETIRVILEPAKLGRLVVQISITEITQMCKSHLLRQKLLQSLLMPNPGFNRCLNSMA